jgi:hypothetical protein
MQISPDSSPNSSGSDSPDSSENRSTPEGDPDAQPNPLSFDGSEEQRQSYLSRIAGQIESMIEQRSLPMREPELQAVLENVPTYIPEKSAIFYEGTILIILKAPWQMAEERVEAIQSALQTHTVHPVEVQWVQDPTIQSVSGRRSDRDSLQDQQAEKGIFPGAQRFYREIQRDAPEGVDIVKTSLYSAPLGGSGSRLNIATVRAHVESERKEDVEIWVRQIEEKYNVGILIQEISDSRVLEDSLLEIAEGDGLVRDAREVRQLMSGIHGMPLPSGSGVCGVAVPPAIYRDLTAEEGIALDPTGSRDLDDIIFAEEPSYSGITRVRTSFVDAAWMIRPNSEMDLYARKAGESFYVRDTNLPLLGDLSYNEMSLLEGQQRFAFTVEMDIDRNGRRLRRDVFRSRVRNHHALDFSTAQGVLEGVPHAAQQVLERLTDPVAALRSDRLQGDGILHLDKGSSLAASVNSHTIVEELMIAARRSLAEFCRENDIPILNKIHVQPGVEVRRELLRELRAVGITARMDRELTRPQDFRQMLAELDNLEEHGLLYKVLDIYTGRSRFDSLPLGHFGLGVDAYTEIKARHYAGIVMQRQLERYFEGLPLLSYDALREKQWDVNEQRRNVPQKMYNLLQYERIGEALDHLGEPFIIRPRHSQSGALRFELSEFPWRWAVTREQVPFELLRGDVPLAGILDGFDPQLKRPVIRDIQRTSII